MPLEIRLDWQGPFGLASAEQRRTFRPPEQPGVYLWTVGANRYQISYVGEAGNISNRMYTHATSMLGGACYLYKDDHITQGADPNKSQHWEYRPGLESLVGQFLSNYEWFSKAAFRNLVGYTFFWAVPVPTVNREIRESIESAIISAAQEESVPIQNVRPSVDRLRARRVHVSNILPSGVTSIHGLRSRCEYGTIE